VTSPRRASVRFTASFEAGLESIEEYLAEIAYPAGYDRLLDTLENVVVPRLERFPAMGRPFLSSKSETYEALLKTEELVERLERFAGSGGVREYLLEDYLILYLHAGETVFLLSIRHFRQVSFEFEHVWLGQRRVN
jgi:plasmid stabilization system protein ParE